MRLGGSSANKSQLDVQACLDNKVIPCKSVDSSKRRKMFRRPRCSWCSGLRKNEGVVSWPKQVRVLQKNPINRIPNGIHNREFHKLSFMKHDKQEVHVAAAARPALFIFSTVKGSSARRFLTQAWARTQAHLRNVRVCCHDVIAAVRFQLLKQVSPGAPGSRVPHCGGRQGCVMSTFIVRSRVTLFRRSKGSGTGLGQRLRSIGGMTTEINVLQ